MMPSGTALPLIVHSNFPRYREYEPRVPVWDLTAGLRGCFHRFFDTWPISPSGRYLAVLRMPDELRINTPGEVADVILIDLHTGQHRVVAQTRGWEPQLGANLNWGADDHTLIFNDVDPQTWQPLLIRLDPLTGKQERTPGGVYHVSPDGRYSAAASMEKMCRTQRGYGVLIPEDRVPINVGASDDDGLFITDIVTGERRLVLSLREAIKYIPDLSDGSANEWHIYGFHSKWSPDGSRLIFTVRRVPRHLAKPFDNLMLGVPLAFDVLTLKPDGSDVHNAVRNEFWKRGGHHINWYPDNHQLSMNLGHFGNGLTLTRVGYDGSDLRPITTVVPGSGHPSVHPNGCLFTDTYFDETPLAFGDGSVPLRWIDPRTGQFTNLVRIMSQVFSDQPLNKTLRVDPHPAWDRSWRYVVFNAVQDNTRHVYIADMQEWL